MDASVAPLFRQAEDDRSSRPAAVTRPSRAEAEAAVRTLIAWAGDDPAREGLIDTPTRVVKAYEELLPRLPRGRRRRSWSAPSPRTRRL